jgi:hypothetical protein
MDISTKRNLVHQYKPGLVGTCALVSRESHSNDGTGLTSVDGKFTTRLLLLLLLLIIIIIIIIIINKTRNVRIT